MAKRPTVKKTVPSGDSKSRVTLIQSEDADVRIPVKIGMKFEVVEVAVVNADFKTPPKIGARLCGYGSNVCLAMIELDA